jgi:pimeloyl-ACP methyl ester carboxylesterase
MTPTVKRIAWGALIAGIAAGGYAVFPLAMFMYAWQTNGPPALHRIAVSKPVLRIRYGTSPMQVADLRIPAGKGPFPLAVVIHGGCFVSATDDMSSIAPVADALTKKGIATLNLEYRKVGDVGGGWPNSYLDIGTGMDMVRGIARRYPIDLGHVSVIGHSAGAHFALWAASRSRLPANSEIRGSDPLKVAAVVAIDGPSALAPFVGRDVEECGEPVIVPLMGGTPSQFPQRYQQVDAGARLPLGMRQGFVKAQLAEGMSDYIAKAKSLGDPVQVYTPDHPYHFRIINPERDEGRKTLALIEAIVR